VLGHFVMRGRFLALGRLNTTMHQWKGFMNWDALQHDGFIIATHAIAAIAAIAAR